MSTRRRIPVGLRAVAIVSDAGGPGLTSAERVALTIRNDATATGRCACGATWELPVALIPGTINRGRMIHEDDCPAISPAAFRAISKSGHQNVIDVNA